MLHPCDANHATWLTVAATGRRGITYLRTMRGDTPVLYGPAGGVPRWRQRVRSSVEDQVTVVAAGVTVHEVLGAADALAAEGIATRVIDLCYVKPVDVPTLRTAAR